MYVYIHTHVVLAGYVSVCLSKHINKVYKPQGLFHITLSKTRVVN